MLGKEPPLGALARGIEAMQKENGPLAMLPLCPESVEYLEAVRGNRLAPGQFHHLRRGEKTPLLNLACLQDKGPVMSAKKDPAPDLVVGGVVIMVEEKVQLSFYAQFFPEFSVRRELVPFSGEHHSASGDIPVPRVDVLVFGALLHEKLTVLVFHQNIAGAVR